MVNDEKLRLIDDARAKALRFAKENGQWEKAGPINILIARRDQLAVAYRTPFQKLFEEKEHINYWRALVGKANLPYGLDVWYDNYKVMNIEWDEIGTLAVISYRPGEWEMALRGLGSG